MKIFKDMFKYAFVLVIVSGLCAGVITYADQVTAPILEQQALEALDYAMNVKLGELYTNIETYEEIETTLPEGLLNLYEVTLSDGSTKYVYNASEQGRNDLINYLIAYSDTGDVEGIIYISHSETPGKGDKVENTDWVETDIVGDNASDLQIDTITGATISSTAVIKGVSDSSEHLLTEVIK